VVDLPPDGGPKFLDHPLSIGDNDLSLLVKPSLANFMVFFDMYSPPLGSLAAADIFV